MKKNSGFQLPCSSDVYCVDFITSNADSIVYGCRDGTISLISIKTSKIIWTNKDSVGDPIHFLAISPSNDMIAGKGRMDCLFVIDASNGNSICFVNVGSISSVLFISQQKILCGFQNGKVAIFCWPTMRIEQKWRVCKSEVFALALSPINNDILLTGNCDGVINQIIISSKKTVMVYEGHTKDVDELSFLSCGNMFVSGSYDHTSRLFTLGQKYAVRVFKGHTEGVRSVDLIHDDELLITTSFDNTVKVWKIESGECLSTVEAEKYFICGAVSKDDQSLVVVRHNRTVTMFSCPPRFAVSLDRTLKLC